jgi:hypothetical protein
MQIGHKEPAYVNMVITRNVEVVLDRSNMFGICANENYRRHRITGLCKSTYE